MNNEEFAYREVVCKENLNKENNDWAKTIAAFANTAGGLMIVGGCDDKPDSGLSNEEVSEHKEHIAKIIDKHLMPGIEVDIRVKEKTDDRSLIHIHVDTSKEIVIYKEEENETVYVRKDGKTSKATIEQIVHLGNRRFGEDDALLNKAFVKKDFAKYLRFAKNTRKDHKAITVTDLIDAGIISQDERITSGFRLFKDRQDDETSAIVCRVYEGYRKDVNTKYEEMVFTGAMTDLFTKTIKYIQKNSGKGLIKTKDGKRIETRSYPEAAVKEAIVNALAHRDYLNERIPIEIDIYKDRITITSPGAWLIDEDIANHKQGSIPTIRRNKVICNCLKMAGLMNDQGNGLSMIQDAYIDFDIKKPQLSSTNDSFTVTMYDLLDHEEAIPAVAYGKYGTEVLKFCFAKPKPRVEIQEHLGYRSRQHFTTDIIDPLLKCGLLNTTEPKQSKKQRYITNRERYKELFESI